MKKAYITVITLFILFIFGVSFADTGKDYKQITIKPSDEVKQGQTIFINIKSSEKLQNPVFKFKNATYKLFSRGDNNYSGLLGINALENPGEYQITLIDETGKLNDNSSIKIVRQDFPSQNIPVTKGMAGLTATAHELSQIGRMKCLITEEFEAGLPPYDNPTAGCINSVFGLKRLYNGKFSGNYHKGIDIKAAEGTPVNAITGGEVIFAEKFRLHGGSVAINHGHGLTSIYIHLSQINVKAGEKVAPGQKIGEVGSTGFATGPHLHWGLYINGVPVDPMTDWIKPAKICM